MFGWFKSTPKPKPVLYRYSQEFTLTTVNDETASATMWMYDKQVGDGRVYRPKMNYITNQGLRDIKEKGINGVWYPMSQIKSITYGKVIKEEIG